MYFCEYLGDVFHAGVVSFKEEFEEGWSFEITHDVEVVSGIIGSLGDVEGFGGCCGALECVA